MSEQPIVWLGKKPKSMDSRKTPVEPAELEPLLTAAVDACSFDYQDHVIAQGEHGSWLVNLAREGCRHRVVWNGQKRIMVLEKAAGPAGWEEVASSVCEDGETEKLVAALKTLLESAEV